MQSDAAASGAYRRLHPSSLLFGVGKAARGLLLPGLFALFALRNSSYQAWWMLLLIPAVGGLLSGLLVDLNYHYPEAQRGEVLAEWLGFTVILCTIFFVARIKSHSTRTSGAIGRALMRA